MRNTTTKRPSFKPSLKVINGISYLIQGMQTLEYSGQWVDDGFDVYRNGQWLTHFDGYPIEDDILAAEKELTKVK